MFKKAILLTLISVSFSANAASLLTESEAEQVKQIKAQFSNTYELKELTKINSTIFTLTSQTATLKSSIIKDKQLYQDYQQKLSEEMFSGSEEQVNFYFKSMKNTSNSIKQSQQKIKQNTAQLKQQDHKVSQLNKALRESRKSYNDKLTSLKEIIVSRIKQEFANPIPMSVSGKLQCSPYQSIRACFESKQITSKLINDAVETRFGLPSVSSTTNKFKVASALMDYDGNVEYQASFNLFVQYNEQIHAQIVKEVGVESFDIHLVSNKPASFYIDGLPVGSGSDVAVKVSKGRYAIQAKFDGQQESSIQDITTPINLTYNFSVPEIDK